MKLKIEQTFNYDLFKKLPGNRPLNISHVRKLMVSMNQEYLIRPIEVNSRLEVVDGQHRLEACKTLGLPVYYIIQKDWGLNQAHMLNANQKNWTIDQYIAGYADKGMDDYIYFRELKNRVKLPVSILLALAHGMTCLAGGRNLQKFKDGLFKIKDRQWAELMAARVIMVKQYHECYKNRRFAMPLCRAIEVGGMDFDVFIHKLQYKAKDLDGCSTEKQYLRVIEDIYNWKNRHKVRLF